MPGTGTKPLADDAYIRGLYAEYGSGLFRYALHLTRGDRQRAEDLVQDAIVRAWRNPPQARIRPWLYTVVRNLAIDAHRALQSRPLESDPAQLEDAPADDDLERAVESWDIADALASLTPEHRQVLIQTYFRGHTTTEAAAILGIPAGTVKSRAFYALKALKLALEERGITQ